MDMGAVATTQRIEAATLGDIVLADPRAAAVFERFGLDFSCDGGATLSRACRETAVNLSAVRHALDALGPSVGQVLPDSSWRAADLIEHIVISHHSYAREMLPVIAHRLAHLVATERDRHPELALVAHHFDALAAVLPDHMRFEEETLFPQLRAVDEIAGGPELAPRPWGALIEQIRRLQDEHRHAGEELAAMRRLTSDYTASEKASATCRVAVEELSEFDRDLRRHIHLENNVLFQRALAPHN